MNSDAADLALIERKLQGLLSVTEEMDFEDRLTSDHEFARKYRLRQSFPSLFHAEGADVIAQDPSAELPPVVRQKQSKRKMIFFVMLVLVLTGCLVFFGWKIFKPSGIEPVDDVLPVLKADTISEDKMDKRMDEETVETPEPVTQTDTLTANEIVNQAIQLETPGDGISFSRSDEILFRWQMETDSFTNFYILKVPEGKMVWWRGIRPGIREYTLPPVKLGTGEYSWYVGQKKFSRRFQIKD